MSDWFETLQNFAGALGGIPKGIDAGMAPFDTWEDIRRKDLANDRSDILLRDLLGSQDARDNAFGYYDDQAGAAQSGFQRTSAGNERDVFNIGIDQNFRSDITDPNGLFQQMMRERGLTPDMPEYRRALAEQMAMYDPTGAIAAYDKMGIPAIEQRNLSRQAVLSYLQAKMPQGVQILPQSDGSFLAVGPDGEEIAIPWQQAVMAASMSGAPTDPMKPVSNALQDQIRVQTGNTAAWSAVNNPRNATNTNENSSLTQARLAINNVMSIANREIEALQRDPNFGTLTPLEQEERLAAPRQRLRAAEQQMQALTQFQLQRGGGYAGGPAAGRFGGQGGGRPAPQGGTTMTTRPSPADMVNRASGGAARPPTGRAPGARGATGSWDMAPPPPAYDTGQRGITQGQPGDARLQAIMQMFGIQ